MDIIYRGTIPEEKKYGATCCNCNTQVQYKLKEVKIHYDPRDGDYHEFECPVCGKLVSTIPSPVPNTDTNKLQPNQFDSLYYNDR